MWVCATYNKWIHVGSYCASMKYKIDYEFPVGTPWNITRTVFDNAVLEAARDVGAEVMTQTRIKDYEFNEGVTVKTSNGDFKGKMVVGATGPADKLASMIREKRNIKPWSDSPWPFSMLLLALIPCFL